MNAPVFGLQFIQQDDQGIPVVGANMDVIGIIGPCRSADPSTFPLNTPVLMFSNDTRMAGLLGEDGFIPDAINAINDQLAPLEVAAQMVIVITPYGTQTDENLQLQQTIANIMGQSNMGTGIWAFLKAPNTLYCTPRIIIAPGYTGQMANSLDTLTVTTIGRGYIPNALYQITFGQGAGETNGANMVMPVAYAVADMNGFIDNAQVTVNSWGAWMTVAPTATLPPPDGPLAPAQPALGQFTFSANPGIGGDMLFNGSMVTFIAHGATPVGLQVPVGLDLGSTLTALQTFLSGSADTQIVKNTYAIQGSSIILTAKTAGAAGNGYSLGGTVFGMSISGPTMTGGADAGTQVQGVLAATMALGANPICSTLPGILNTLLAHAIVESAGTSTIADESWRTTLNSQRIIGLSGGVKIQDPISGSIIVMPLAPRVAGLLVAEDFRTGFPFHSAANRAINGIVGPSRTIGFSLTDGATEGQVLLGANLGIVVRGLVGVETAISSGGFIFIGTDNLGDDPLWQFYNVQRGADYIVLSLMPSLRVFLGRQNIDAQTVAAIYATINDFLAQLKAEQQILGYKTTFSGSLNSAAEIRLGHLTGQFAAEEPPVLRRITTYVARYAPAIDAMVAELEQQLNVAAA